MGTGVAGLRLQGPALRGKSFSPPASARGRSVSCASAQFMLGGGGLFRLIRLVKRSRGGGEGIQRRAPRPLGPGGSLHLSRLQPRDRGFRRGAAGAGQAAGRLLPLWLQGEERFQLMRCAARRNHQSGGLAESVRSVFRPSNEH